MDRKLERAADELIELAYDAGIDLLVEEADFEEEPYKQGKVVFVLNEQTGQIGCMSVDVREFPDSEICFFILEMAQYKYFIQEGFEPEDIVTAEGLENRVFKHVTKNELWDRMLKDGN